MTWFNSILYFVKNAFVLSFLQMLTIFGALFLFGLILYLLARFTRNSFVKSIGQNADIYFTGWIGTPIHELGHAVFCIIFRHEITGIKLFSPKAENGSLGYVNHAYNAHNPWHRVGNFFIGFGPILFGSVIIYLLIKYFVPDSEQVVAVIKQQSIDFSSIQGLKFDLTQLWESSFVIIKSLFSDNNVHSWQLWVFMYLALCISSHMELSPSDLKGVGSGLLAIFIVLLVLNAVLMLLNINMQHYLNYVVNFIGLSTGLLLFSTLLSALLFLVSFGLLNLYMLVRYRTVFHPFA